MFRTTVGSLAIFKEELPAPSETLIKAGWVQHSVCTWWVVSSCLYKRSSNCVAQMVASNKAGPLSDGYTVKIQSING